MSSYEQVLAGTSFTPTETFLYEGSPQDVDSGTPTLAVTKPDGTAFTPTPTVQTTWAGRTTGQYRWAFNPQPAPYKLTYQLTGTIGGVAQTLSGTVEWVGEFPFNIAELRQMRVAGSKPFTDTTAYPNSDIQHVRAEILDEFRQILNFHPVPRFIRETHTLGWNPTIALDELHGSRVLSVTVAGVAQTASNYVIARDMTLTPVSGSIAQPWPSYATGSMVTVEYVAGLDRVPGRGRAAAMLMAGAALNPAGWTTATTVSLPTGETYTYEPAETGRGGFERHTGVRELDRWLNRWAAASAGVA